MFFSKYIVCIKILVSGQKYSPLLWGTIGEEKYVWMIEWFIMMYFLYLMPLYCFFNAGNGLID
jgi:hypothetical protein